MTFSNLQYEREVLSGDRLSFFVVISSLFSFISQTAIILLSFNKLPPEIPLFYSRPWGGKILASPKELWILPGILGLIFTINWILARILVSKNSFLFRTLMIFTFISAVCTLVATLKIIFLIT